MTSLVPGEDPKTLLMKQKVQHDLQDAELKRLKRLLDDKVMDKHAYDALVQKALGLSSPVVDPGKDPKDNPKLALEDASTTNRNQTEAVLNGWFGTPAHPKIAGEAWQVFMEQGPNKYQREEVKNFLLQSNLNKKMAELFKTAGQGVTPAICSQKTHFQDDTETLAYEIAQTTISYFIADLAAIIASWWMAPGLTSKDVEARAICAAETRTTLVREQNDYGQISILRTCFAKKKGLGESLKEALSAEKEHRTPCITCGKTHLGVCRLLYENKNKDKTPSKDKAARKDPSGSKKKVMKKPH